ncbi:RHS repeat domain-containing protein, partial [Pseudomonas sp. NFPP28]|uniref:RHS repeat domain-containing protein n=1 Tax=Pseudomonas sp. NFPP28 TaxID=1566231 RepID=UPI0008F255DA
NLLMQNRPGPDIVAGNRLMIQGDHHYDYDAFGNLIRERRGKGHALVTEYRYDCQHRLISITRPDGQIASYRYDPFGRRISKTVDGITTEFFWQGDKLIAEHHQDRHRSYLYEPDSFRPLALLEGFGPKETKAYHYQLDHLGTPQELTAPDGEIVWSAHYRAYGEITRLDIGKVDNPLRFQGQYFDQESGLHYNRHRYYNPDVGRYLTPDPVKLAGGINAYQYVPNPTGWVDPLGLSACPGGDKCKPTTEVKEPETKANTNEGEPFSPSTSNTPPKMGYHKETYANKPIKPEETVRKWDEFLGPGPHTNINPRTGKPDRDRIVSGDAKRSIRYGSHEMSSKPSKHHYHEETWTLELKTSTINVDNTVVRVPLPKK